MAERQEVINLLCVEMTESERARRLGITRPSYYGWLHRLVADGVLVCRGIVPPDMKFRASHPMSSRSSGHHAPVLHVRWVEGDDRWSVQGVLLDSLEEKPTRYGDLNIVIRRQTGDKTYYASFVHTTPARIDTHIRWSTRDTMRNLPIEWSYTDQLPIKKLTLAIARVIDGEALLIPEEDD